MIAREESAQKNKKAYYVDTFAHNSTHEMFNAASLYMFSMIYEEIAYRASNSSKDTIFSYIPDVSGISHRQIFVPGGDTRLMMFIRYLSSAVLNIIMLFRVPRDIPIVYNFNNCLSLHLVNFFNKFLKRKVLIVCHGELEHLRKPRPVGGILNRLLIMACKSFFLKKDRTISTGIYFALLGESLERNFCEVVNNQHVIQRVLTFDHPFIFSKFKNGLDGNVNRFAAVGSISPQKGLHQIMDLAKRTNDLLRNGSIQISLLGRVYASKANLDEHLISYLPGYSVPVPRASINDSLQTQHFILFFYPRDGYKLAASGAIFDAINFEVPVIALKNDYFTYLFEKFGPLGYLVESVEEIEVTLRSVASLPRAAVTFNFERAKEGLSPESIAKSLIPKLTARGLLA